jgi:penicillin G amidase
MGGGPHRWRAGVGGTIAVLAGLALPATVGADALEAEAVLPPGNSGYVSIAGVASGTGSPHLNDQTELFTNFELRPFGFDQPGESESPKPGVTITRDAYGVPRIDAASDRDAWWGVGYAAGQDRLFQLELFKRAGNGTLAEILGRDYLDDDLIARRDYYTDAEMQAMIDAVPDQLRQRLEAYRDGINAYIEDLSPLERPGEFVALNVPITPFTSIDLARTGVLLARTVPSGDGNELENAQVLAKIGAKDFDFLHPVRTKGQIGTVKAPEGRFPSQPGRTRKDERKGFSRSRRFLDGIDVAGAGGTGTLPQSAGEAIAAERGESMGADLRRIMPQGGSFMWAINDRERERGYLFNGPQLGYSIPELFYEYELHSDTQDIRGVSAAGIPVVGIGHNGDVAWGFTSGLSDEDDLFAVELVDEDTYIYKGEQRDMECRDEVFDYNAPPTDLPGLTDPSDVSGSVTERICRTVHGPVQARGDGVAFARRYAIWNRELETLSGLSALNDARTIKDVDAAMDDVTWNENVIATDSKGRIGYWHPGLHPLRPLRWDERLPYPGDGSAEWRGFLAPDERPQVVNPKRGWVANWNNPPSAGWTNGDGPARERLSGNLHRVRILQDLVAKVARNPSYVKSRAIELTSGATAQQFPYLNVRRVRNAERRTTPAGKATLKQLRRWDGNYNETDESGTVDPGVAIWEEFKDQVETLMLRRHGGDDASPLAGETGSSHEFDITNGEALGLRTVGPKGYAKAAKRTAKRLEGEFGSADPASWREPRRLYDVSAQGAAATPELPFFDRGTWSQSLAMGSGG